MDVVMYSPILESAISSKKHQTKGSARGGAEVQYSERLIVSY